MAWVATNGNGKEFLFEKKPYRSGRGSHPSWVCGLKLKIW